MTPTHTCAVALHPVFIRRVDGSLTESMNLDPNMLHAVMERVVYRHLMTATLVDVLPAERDKHGVTEWLVLVTFTSGSRMTIGALQRTPGGTVEFHS